MALSPDGTRLAVATLPQPGGIVGPCDVWVYRLTGSRSPTVWTAPRCAATDLSWAG